MNWQTYASLTDKQKDEFNFRFKDRAFIANGLVHTINVFLLIFTVFILSVAMILTNPLFESLKSRVLEQFVIISKITIIFLIVCIAEVLYGAIKTTHQAYGYMKWKKENNIKEKFFWSKNEK